jgi:penicillin-binding protein 1A
MMERLFQKPIEWVIAVQLERYYTKEEIINMYLNKFDFLYNAVGIQSASRVYFGKTPKTLKIEEAATLVGMCKNPSYFNPVRHNKRTIGRRNTVLEQLDGVQKDHLYSLVGDKHLDLLKETITKKLTKNKKH